MIRRAFLKRMGLAFVASAFVDVQTFLPVEDEAGALVGSVTYEPNPYAELTELLHEVFTESVLPHLFTRSPLSDFAADHAARDLRRERAW